MIQFQIGRMRRFDRILMDVSKIGQIGPLSRVVDFSTAPVVDVVVVVVVVVVAAAVAVVVIVMYCSVWQAWVQYVVM